MSKDNPKMTKRIARAEMHFKEVAKARTRKERKTRATPVQLGGMAGKAQEAMAKKKAMLDAI